MKETSEKQENQSSRRSARRRAMMDAAWELLLEKGFSGVTLNDVISRSGGSRTTVYEAFGGKDGLLAAVMEEQCMEFSAELHISLESDLPPRDALTDFGKKLAKKILTEEAIRFTQILFSEGQHFIPLVEKFMKVGPDSTRARLSRYLRRQHDLGHIVVDDPVHDAELFNAMIIGDWQKQILKMIDPPTYSNAEIEKRVLRAVEVFLCGVGSENYRKTADDKN
ncbi:TetR/AcrR family transcriptional regulator [Thalassospira lohafexi]|uniref:TetR family transcriptional regulator n=1 Tax=Thalassospira lohafexi TaxID=744227 RepID=A0A2N3L6Y2_9PROT|nr:TetR/AcrR family transcriptional regulator [Thalassospira lohafexi]PKR58457.1 TetR family transcriptional regulator [Thalassospira lohafexi]